MLLLNVVVVVRDAADCSAASESDIADAEGTIMILLNCACHTAKHNICQQQLCCAVQCCVRSIDYIFFLAFVVRVACNAIMQLYCTCMCSGLLLVQTQSVLNTAASSTFVWSGCPQSFRNERRYCCCYYCCLMLLLLLHSCRYCSTVHFCFFFCLLHCLLLLLVVVLGCYAMLCWVVLRLAIGELLAS